jgi:hypothetical protein
MSIIWDERRFSASCKARFPSASARNFCFEASARIFSDSACACAIILVFEA